MTDHEKKVAERLLKRLSEIQRARVIGILEGMAAMADFQAAASERTPAQR